MRYVLHVQGLPNMRTRAGVRPKPLSFEYRHEKSHGDKRSGQENRRKKNQNLHSMLEDKIEIQIEKIKTRKK
jgi:hypothetical protein